MKIFVLIVMMHVSGGSIINFQEFNDLDKCQYAAQLVNSRINNVGFRVDAFCVAK